MIRGLKLLFIQVIVLSLMTKASAQNLAKAEYFFDLDPGQGNGFNLPVTPAPNLNFTSSISVAGLPSGFHILGLRVKENGGVWSLFEGRGFYISTLSANAADLSKAEYFIDTDPGQGSGTPITIPSGANSNFIVNVPTTSLAAGFHFLAIRARDMSGRWSMFEGRGFFLTTSTSNVPDIAAAEYFYDTDPGNGTATLIPITPGPTTNFTVPLPLGGLASGFHFLAVRVKTSDGKWGIFEGRGFYVSGSITNAPTIAAAEYFFDTDPGPGHGTFLTIPTGDVSNFNVDLAINTLTPGFHFLTIRIKDSANRWGQFETRGFYVYPGAAAAGDIVAAEYFIDTDPGQGLGSAAIVATPAQNINQVFPLEVSGASPGPHKLGFRVRDAEGVWSETKMSDITVLDCTAPPSPVATSADRCNAGTVKLTASGAISGQQYRWYEQELSGSSVFTGSEFTTPSLSSTTDYYVSIFDPATTCESGRVKATAAILQIAKPVLNASGTITLCEGTSFLLSAPDGFESYQWSDGSQTQQVLVVKNGKYSVVVNNGTCDLPLSDEVTFNFLARPQTPTITVIGSTNICVSASVTLEAPAGADAYLWSNGATTASITVNTSGSYQLTVTNVLGCKSESSVNVVQTGLPCLPGGGTNPDNFPPAIEYAAITTALRGKATLDLIPLISDPNGPADVVLATLKIIGSLPSGAQSDIDEAGILTVDYNNTDFSGSELLTVQVCDLSASCTQRDIEVTVAGEITPFNALSPNGDGMNESLYLEFIDIIPDTKNNKVTIFNRWGSPVFEVIDYNNNDRVFKGMDQSGKDLPNGTYFYRVEFTSGKRTRDGFITLRR